MVLQGATLPDLSIDSVLCAMCDTDTLCFLTQLVCGLRDYYNSVQSTVLVLISFRKSCIMLLLPVYTGMSGCVGLQRQFVPKKCKHGQRNLPY